MKVDLKHKLKVENVGYEYLYTYEKGEYTISSHILIKYNKYMRVKCPYCKTEYDISCGGFMHKEQKCSRCCHKYSNSFAHYIEKELGESLDKYWDWDKNTVNPYYIYKNSNIKIWIKCVKLDYHDSYLIYCPSFIMGNRCSYCAKRKIHPKDSFAQYHIDNTDEDFLTKYWSDKNTINPWEISPSCNKKLWIKCCKHKFHEDYKVRSDHFTSGSRCPYCSKTNGKVHPRDSFGTLHPSKSKYWSKRNKKSPFEVAPRSKSKYWFMCEKCGSDFEKSIDNMNRNSFVLCSKCNLSKGEFKIIECFIKSLNMKENIDFETQKEFKGLLGLGGGNLSYDFYLPKYNLLIEYQGEFHDGTVELQTNDEFKKQQEHDRRKKEYAKAIGIDLLEIWYWDFDNIEHILMNEINKLGGF